MEYIVAGYNMLTDIYYADGTTVQNTPGGSFYSASGVKFWRDSVAYVGTAGPDFPQWYGAWFRANAIDCRVKECLPKTLKYTLTYGANGIWSEKCTYGEEYETAAKDIGRITPEMLASCADGNTRGIYLEASLSAKIADCFREIKALVPNGVFLWEINGDDLRDPEKKNAIEERISVADAFSLNLDEAQAFFGTTDGDAILHALASYGKPCFFRLGEKGAGIVRGGSAVFGRSVGTEKSVDPTGCGNCSTAASMIGLAEHLSDEETIAMANIAAGACAAQNGPFPCVTAESRKTAEKARDAYLREAPFTYGRLL